MEVALRVGGVAVCAALMGLLLRKSNAELALCLTLAAAAAALALALGLASGVAEALRRAREMSGLSPALFTPVVKCVAVGIVSSLASGACRDAGSETLSRSVELAGAGAALYCALPLLTSLLDTVEGLL